MPANSPVLVSKLAQLGLLMMLKVWVSCVSLSVRVGIKLYAASSAVVVLGEPLNTGTTLYFLVTVAVTAALALPAVSVTIAENVNTPSANVVTSIPVICCVTALIVALPVTALLPSLT